MDVWVGHAMRRRECINCTQVIEPGEQVAIGQWKRTHPWGTRTKRVVSHWQCYVVKQEMYMLDHPYMPTVKAGPGRPVKYTKEQRTKRVALQANIKRWGLQQQAYIGDGMWVMAERYQEKVNVARGMLDSM